MSFHSSILMIFSSIRDVYSDKAPDIRLAYHCNPERTLLIHPYMTRSNYQAIGLPPSIDMIDNMILKNFYYTSRSWKFCDKPHLIIQSS